MKQVTITGRPTGGPFVNSDEMKREFEPARVPFHIIGDGGRVYLVQRETEASDTVREIAAELGEPVEDDILIFTMRRAMDGAANIDNFPVVSRRRLVMADTISRMKLERGAQQPSIEEFNAFSADEVREVMAYFVSLVVTNPGSIPLPDVAEDRRSVPQLVESVWPDDMWAGTIEEIVALIEQSTKRKVSEANVKKALQRGSYKQSSTGVGRGHATIWKRDMAKVLGRYVEEEADDSDETESKGVDE